MKILKVVVSCLVGLVIGIGSYFLLNYQFEIYKKKHGQDMTFFEFLLDAETGN